MKTVANWGIYWLVSLWALVTCQQPLPLPPTLTAPPATETLLVGVGDGAMGLVDLAAYSQQGLTLTYPTTSDVQLLADLDAGILDAALVHHIPSEYADLWQNPVALDGIVLIVQPDNPLQTISLAQAQALFSGEIQNWSALQGAGQVALIMQENDSGVGALFERFVMRDQRVSINAEVRPNAATVVEAIANNPNAIGYTTLAALTADVRALRIDDIMATPTTLGTQEYPLTIPIYWVATNEPEGQARALLGYLQSVEGQVLLGQMFGRIR